MRKILFLDVDGVLNNSELPRRPDRNILPELKGQIGIDKELLENFRIITSKHPDLEIVLSSTWRLGHTNLVQIAFERARVPFNLVGKTPQTYSGHRGREIQMWVDQNVYSPAKLVAIDDDINAGSFEFGSNEFYYARTEWEEGLTVTLVNNVINFLKHENHCEE